MQILAGDARSETNFRPSQRESACPRLHCQIALRKDRHLSLRVTAILVTMSHNFVVKIWFILGYETGERPSARGDWSEAGSKHTSGFSSVAS